MDAAPLIERWKAEAARLRELGQEGLATFEERLVLDLEEWLADHAFEALTVAEAAAESGYSESAIYTMISEGRLRNVHSKGSPRVRRRDLPRKPGHRSATEFNLHRATGT